MTLLDALRLVWMVGTGVGTLIMLYLLREVVADVEAIEALDRPGLALARDLSQGEVTDQTIRLFAVGTLFIAGVSSYARLPELTVVLLLVSALAQVALAVVKVTRRRRVFRDIRLLRRSRTSA